MAELSRSGCGVVRIGSGLGAATPAAEGEGVAVIGAALEDDSRWMGSGIASSAPGVTAIGKMASCAWCGVTMSEDGFQGVQENARVEAAVPRPKEART